MHTHDQEHTTNCCDHEDGHHHHHEHSNEHAHETGTAEYIRLGLMAVVILASLTGWWKGYMNRDWLAFAATLIGGFPIFEEAWENLRKRRMTMELSMTIALVGALCIGQFFTALVIAFFVIFAELLEGFTVGSGRRAIEKLIDSLPRSVTVRRDGQERELGIGEISSGETIIIRPGERVPADGTVTKGHSFVDQASITGESLPVEKTEGSKVFAGTINKDGVLEVKAEKIGRDTTFGKIIEIVEQAEKSKAPVQRVADRLAAGLVYFALGAAILTFIVTRNLTSTIAVIIVAGACGVAAGTPLAILAGIGSAARRGIIIKGGLYLEQLNTIVICHGDFLNADHDYVHKNKSVKGFGSYGDIMIRDRKMYVAPTPFGLTTGTAHNQTLILPADFPTDSRFRAVGKLLRCEAEKLIVGYSFDLRTNMLKPESVKNPAAGKEHKFAAYRLNDSAPDAVTSGFIVEHFDGFGYGCNVLD